jgi:hypothetical protein
VDDSGDRSGVRREPAQDVFDAFAPDYAYCHERFPKARDVCPHATLAG